MDIYILAIETSCDETSVAIVKNGNECISLSILTQMDIHANYGGVVPEIASRLHTENITLVIDDALTKAKMKIVDMDAIAVTNMPGLMGSLLVGLECAKALSFIYKKPLITVNHLMGHIYANNLENKIVFPALALIVSGGHTDMLFMRGDYDYQVIGRTLDDAIGECYDKVARVLGLKYPGGPNIEKLAKLGKHAYNLSIPMKDNSLNFSFSGLKSSIINLVHTECQRGNEINKADLACSFQEVAIKELTNKLTLALKKYPVKSVTIAGGVSANKYLQSEALKVTTEFNIPLLVPQLIYCTDNAAMIGAAAYPLYLKKEFANLDANCYSVSNLEES